MTNFANRSALPAAVAFMMVGCASTPVETVERVAEARTLVQQAEASGAAEYASDALSRARDNLQQAAVRQDNNRPKEALRPAEKAVVDAELALAATRAAKAQQAEAELRSSVDALRRESRRTP